MITERIHARDEPVTCGDRRWSWDGCPHPAAPPPSLDPPPNGPDDGRTNPYGSNVDLSGQVTAPQVRRRVRTENRGQNGQLADALIVVPAPSLRARSQGVTADSVTITPSSHSCWRPRAPPPASLAFPARPAQTSGERTFRPDGSAPVRRPPNSPDCGLARPVARWSAAGRRYGVAERVRLAVVQSGPPNQQPAPDHRDEPLSAGSRTRTCPRQSWRRRPKRSLQRLRLGLPPSPPGVVVLCGRSSSLPWFCRQLATTSSTSIIRRPSGGPGGGMR